LLSRLARIAAEALAPAAHDPRRPAAFAGL